MCQLPLLAREHTTQQDEPSNFKHAKMIQNEFFTVPNSTTISVKSNHIFI